MSDEIDEGLGCEWFRGSSHTFLEDFYLGVGHRFLRFLFGFSVGVVMPAFQSKTV